jgi:hypothetical protein
MKKPLAALFLLCVVFCGFTLLGGVPVSGGQSVSNVGGVISTDTTLTAANSPYTLTSPLTVSAGATLTIEAGVTVNLNGYNIQVNGILFAQGSNNANIIFSSASLTGGIVAFSAHSASWDEQACRGCIIENAVLNSVSVTVNSASPKLSNNTINAANLDLIDGSALFIDAASPLITGNIIQGDIEQIGSASPIISNNSITGGIYGMGMLTNSPIITNNVIKNGSEERYGIGVRCDGTFAYVADNVIYGCRTGIDSYDGAALIERNLVFNNSNGILVYAEMSPISATILNNTIRDNDVGISGGPGSGSLTLMYNNFENNSKTQLIAANASYNWWGTTDEQVITQMLSGSESTTFVPFLNESNSYAFPIPLQTSTPAPNPTATPTAISISVDVASAFIGSTVYVNGRLTDVNGTALQNQSVVLSYAVEGNNSWIPIGSGRTDSDGCYSIQWASAASGTFALKTEWSGNTDYLGVSNSTTLSFLPYENQKVFFVESNSTVTELAFNSTTSELSFAVQGASGTAGYVKLTIAKSLISNPQTIKVYLDGNQLNYTVTENPDSWQLTFIYHHSTHQVKIEMATNAATHPAFSGADNWVWGSVVAIVVVAAAVAGFAVWRTKKKLHPA